MESLRIVVTGTVGAGKSTFVRTFSENPVIETERMATDETALLKKKTTVAFDFGMRSLGRGMDLQIYGTPGQSRFDFMWDILIRRAHAYILLMAAHRPNDFHNARQILAFMNQRVQIPMIIGLTHSDLPGAWTPAEMAMRLGFLSERDRTPIIPVNPTNQTSVFETVMVLMSRMILQANNESHPKPGLPNPPTPLRSRSKSYSSSSLLQFSNSRTN